MRSLRSLSRDDKVRWGQWRRIKFQTQSRSFLRRRGRRNSTNPTPEALNLNSPGGKPGVGMGHPLTPRRHVDQRSDLYRGVIGEDIRWMVDDGRWMMDDE